MGIVNRRFRHVSLSVRQWARRGLDADWILAPRTELDAVHHGRFDEYDTLLGKLGKYKIGKSCLYINKLADIDMDVLRELVRRSYEHMHKTNPR